ncbi:hypothetical protein QUA13_29670 [Microcoleus sp. S28C3]|uniref:hypothetical protein n=1 Tax=Microcoleus sp. S28C3 TaxID=3055414 RepID=UPI002FD2547D
MSNTTFDKKPAFFRVTSAEMFFEADVEITEDIQLDEAVEKEIDDLIESLKPSEANRLKPSETSLV